MCADWEGLGVQEQRLTAITILCLPPVPDFRLLITANFLASLSRPSSASSSAGSSSSHPFGPGPRLRRPGSMFQRGHVDSGRAICRSRRSKRIAILPLLNAAAALGLACFPRRWAVVAIYACLFLMERTRVVGPESSILLAFGHPPERFANARPEQQRRSTRFGARTGRRRARGGALLRPARCRIAPGC